jgi:hypothetical protein
MDCLRKLEVFWLFQFFLSAPCYEDHRQSRLSAYWICRLLLIPCIYQRSCTHHPTYRTISSKIRQTCFVPLNERYNIFLRKSIMQIKHLFLNFLIGVVLHHGMPCAPIEIKSIMTTVTFNLIFHVMILVTFIIITELIDNFFIFCNGYGNGIRVIALRASDMKIWRIGHSLSSGRLGYTVRIPKHTLQPGHEHIA